MPLLGCAVLPPRQQKKSENKTLMSGTANWSFFRAKQMVQTLERLKISTSNHVTKWLFLCRCAVCKDAFAPAEGAPAPAFDGKAPTDEMFEELKWNARRKQARAAWPWPPFDTVEQYRSEPEPEPEPDRETRTPPWHPFEPPFTARAPAGSNLYQTMQWKQQQEAARLRHGLLERKYGIATDPGAHHESPAHHHKHVIPTLYLVDRPFVHWFGCCR